MTDPEDAQQAQDDFAAAKAEVEHRMDEIEQRHSRGDPATAEMAELRVAMDRLDASFAALQKAPSHLRAV
jgi:hypothetical protein